MSPPSFLFVLARRLPNIGFLTWSGSGWGIDEKVAVTASSLSYYSQRSLAPRRTTRSVFFVKTTRLPRRKDATER